MNQHYQYNVISNRSGFNLAGRPVFGLVLGGLLLMSGCASTQSYQYSCPVAPESVTATQSQAEAGDAASQYQVGSWYQVGRCLKQDKTIATEWFRRGAEQGHPDAQYELGRMYSYGRGIEQDEEEAARWYQKAAKQDHAPAALRLGELYARSSDVARDADRAEYWYRRAVEGNALSQADFDRLLADLEKNKDQQRLAEERKQEQQRLAEERVHEQQRLAEAGDREAQYQLGILYSGRSNDVEPNLHQAFQWFQKSADQGDPRAQYKLGEFYIAGGNDGETAQAWADVVSSDTLIGDWGGWFNGSDSAGGEIKLRIAERDDEHYTGHILKIPAGPSSRTCKGAPIKLNGGTGNRYAVSFNRRNVCQAKGEFVRTGQTLKGEILFEGWRSPVGVSLTRLGRDISSVQTLAAGNTEVERNLTLAAEWFQKSADQGYAEAQFALGLMHEAGIGGMSKDVQNAKDLYQKAADQRHYLANQQICALSDNCTPAPKYTPKSTGATDGELSPLVLLCFLHPVAFVLCSGGM